MEKEVIQIENLKCGGCASSIRMSLGKLKNVREVIVDVDHSEVKVSADKAVDRQSIVSALAKLGYPEVGQGNTLQKMKSYVSCAVGKLSN